MATLWDTHAREVVSALAAERRSAGALITGIVLTLVLVTDERNAPIAVDAAIDGALDHPCRLLVVIRRQPDAREARLDAEVDVGGRLKGSEAVTLRMYGRLARHAESVVLPLLAPDTPVVSWWYGTPPQRLAHDPLGALASRRITDCALADDPLAALRRRAADYHPGDTDLSWSRMTPWRAVLAAAFDADPGTPRSATVYGGRGNPSVALLAGWLAARLDVPTSTVTATGRDVAEVAIETDDGKLTLTPVDGTSGRLSQAGRPDREFALPQRSLGDLLAEELRHLDADEPYADALAAHVRINKNS